MAPSSRDGDRRLPGCKGPGRRSPIEGPRTRANRPHKPKHAQVTYFQFEIPSILPAFSEMEWPSADQAPALIKAVKAFFDSPGQEPSSQSLDGLLSRLEELRRGDQPEVWDRLIESLADACRDRKSPNTLLLFCPCSRAAQQNGASPSSSLEF